MSALWQYAVLGIGAGSVYALLGNGIVLIFRGSGVINFAHGAFAMLAAFLFLELHTNNGWGTGPAMVVAVGAVTILGVATDQVIMRPLRHASPLARLIATLCVLLLVESAAVLAWGGNPVVVLPVIQGHPVTVLGATITSDRLWLLGIAAAVTAVLAAAWRFTRAGWLMEAASESQFVMAANGWSPEAASGATWGIGAALAGIAGVLVAPITQLDVSNLSLTVIVALAAGLLGGFRSFGLTMVGGLAIGIAQSVLSNYYTTPGVQDAVPLVAIVVILMIRGSTLPLRGYIADRMPRIGSGRIRASWVVPSVLAALVASFVISSPSWLTAIGSTTAVAVILLSLVVLMGYTGQVSLAQYGLAGLGALIAATLVGKHGWDLSGAIVAGVAGASLAGLVVAIPALRTRGINLAVVTLALGLVIQSVVFNSDSLSGGIGGINVNSLTFFGWSLLPIEHPDRYTAFVVVCFALVALLVANLRRSVTGRRLLAVRESERAAAACGLSVTGLKRYSFALAGALAGLGGILLAFESATIVFTGFDPATSILATLQTVIGGVGYVAGTLFGATLASSSFGSIVVTSFPNISIYLPIVGAVGAIVTLLQHQAGIGSTLERQLRSLLKREPAAQRVAAGAGHRVPPKSLTVSSLTVAYGGMQAVKGVSVDLRPGEVVGLIGPNGAGKTSFIDAVTGFTPAGGTITLDGVRIDRMRAHDRARHGLARSFQALELFDQMTVLENIQVASERNVRWRALADLLHPRRLPLSAAAAAATEEFGLAEYLPRYPEELSHGQLRLVGIARAVAMEPSVLLLDEPAAGLHDQESRELAELVRRLADEWGMAILVIEHDMDFVTTVSDRMIVMDFGAEIARGTPGEIAVSPAAIAAYLGTATEPTATEQAATEPTATEQAATEPAATEPATASSRAGRRQH